MEKEKLQCFSKNLFVSIRHMKKEMQGSHYLSFFALSNLLFIFCRTGQLTSSEHAKCTLPILFIITFVCFSVPTYCILMQVNSQ